MPFPSLDFERHYMHFSRLSYLHMRKNLPGLPSWRMRDSMEESPVAPAEVIPDSPAPNM